MKKVIKILAPTLTFIVFAVTINWGYVGYVSKMLLQAAGEVARGEGTTSQQLLVELRDMQARDVFNMEVIGRMPFVDTDEDPEDVSPTSEPADEDDEPQIAADAHIHNMRQSVSGKTLTGIEKEKNDVFRGDLYSQAGSYDGKTKKVNATKHEQFVEVNFACTCGIGDNIKGEITNGNENYKGKFSLEQNKCWDQLEKRRKSLNGLKVTNETIMQKVITEDVVSDYVNGRNDASGCVARACDAAPYAYNLKTAYDNLRLDYKDTPYEDMLPDGDIYVLRYQQEPTGVNETYPTLDMGFPPPCTETGFVASENYLIPEYMANRTTIIDGAIFVINKDCEERLYAYYDNDEKKFITVD